MLTSAVPPPATVAGPTYDFHRVQRVLVADLIDHVAATLGEIAAQEAKATEAKRLSRHWEDECSERDYERERARTWDRENEQLGYEQRTTLTYGTLRLPETVLVLEFADDGPHPMHPAMSRVILERTTPFLLTIALWGPPHLANDREELQARINRYLSALWRSYVTSESAAGTSLAHRIDGLQDRERAITTALETGARTTLARTDALPAADPHADDASVLTLEERAQLPERAALFALTRDALAVHRPTDRFKVPAVAPNFVTGFVLVPNAELTRQAVACLPTPERRVGCGDWTWSLFSISAPSLHAARFIGRRVAAKGLDEPLAQMEAALVVASGDRAAAAMERITTEAGVRLLLRSQLPAWSDGNAIIADTAPADFQTALLARNGFPEGHDMHAQIAGAPIAALVECGVDDATTSLETLAGDMLRGLFQAQEGRTSERRKHAIQAFVARTQDRACSTTGLCTHGFGGYTLVAPTAARIGLASLRGIGSTLRHTDSNSGKRKRDATSTASAEAERKKARTVATATAAAEERAGGLHTTRGFFLITDTSGTQTKMTRFFQPRRE